MVNYDWCMTGMVGQIRWQTQTDEDVINEERHVITSFTLRQSKLENVVCSENEVGKQT